MKVQIAGKWQVTNLGEPSKIIRIEITRGSDYIAISQKQYIELILCKEKMEKANPIATPLDLNIPIEPNPDESDGDRSNPFTHLLGELQYLANATRPDIAFAVNRLALYTANPSMLHYSMLKRILRYLAGTKKHSIKYRKTYAPQKPLIGYTDAGFANTDKKKSMTGIIYISAGGVVLWKSKKQTLSTLSTMEAEYIALAHAGTEAHWFHNLYMELGFPL
jgi:hypothetical protein